MFGIGMPEMLLILAVALIVIGPKKLPDLARSLGKAMGEFKKATSELKDSIQIDSELKDVKTAFNEIDRDLKKTPPVHEDKTSAQNADDPPPQENPVDPVDAVKAAFTRDDDHDDSPSAAHVDQDAERDGDRSSYPDSTTPERHPT